MSSEGILAKLTEVKDIQTYIKVRLVMLEGREEQIVNDLEPGKREKAIKQVKGRKKELEKFRQVLNEEGLKEYSQRNWHEVQNTDE